MIADHVDYRFYSRLVEGITKRRRNMSDSSFRLQTLQCLSNILRTRHYGDDDNNDYDHDHDLRGADRATTLYSSSLFVPTTSSPQSVVVVPHHNLRRNLLVTDRHRFNRHAQPMHGDDPQVVETTTNADRMFDLEL